MDKLKMQTPNRADENFKKLAALFPNAVTETVDENGVVVRAIDKDVLMQEINTTVVDGKDERYQFTWPDKKKSVLLANAPIAKTLRPCPAESMGKDGTPGGFDSENLYIEGDNLEVLKLLQETYLGKIKMIYIDPPYNTGNDFVYEDDFAQSTEEYLANSGQYDEEGNRLVKNMDTNGRFHTDWLNMIYPRLKLAKDLLSDDGVIFISIDDSELDNLSKLCNDVFGENNCYGKFVWQRRSGSMDSVDNVSIDHEYVLCYGKAKTQLKGILRTFAKYTNPDNDPRGPWIADNLTAGKPGGDVYYPITDPETGNEFYPPKGRYWPYSRETMRQKIAEGRILFPKNSDGRPMLKRFQNEAKNLYVPVSTIMHSWTEKNIPNNAMICAPNTKGTSEMQELFGGKVFSFPKSTVLLKSFLEQGTDKDSVVLDFFSGSATTAHTVMQLNAEDGGKRKFIMVQLPEETDEKSEAYKAGYKNICEIGKERIRRASAKIKEENPLGTMDLDVGFRVLKCDTTNMKKVYYHPDEYNATMFDMLEDNIKEDRTPEDLLFQVMLDLGVLLSSKIEQTEIAGKKVFNVAGNFLIACFDANVTEETITAIAKLKPYYFVMRDSSLANDSVAANFDQIFATYSPDTVRKVL